MARQRGVLIKVSIFAVVMLLVAVGLVVIFGQFRFSSINSYHAIFENASRLKGGNDVRIAGIPVGSVKDLQLKPDNTVDVTFTVDKRYQMYTSTKAVIRYQNLVGDRFLEITSGPGELRKVPPGGTIQHTEPALDLDALLGGLRPVLKGLSGDKANKISNAIIELLQGQGGALSDLLSSTGSFSRTLADRYQVISDVIHNLNTVLTTVDDKSAQFNESIDQLQKLVTGLAQGRDPIAGALQPLASAASDLTDVLQRSRRPIQGVIENLRPLATEMDNRKDEINRVVEPLGENYLRLNALGAYGAFFNIYYCSTRIKINGPSVGPRPAHRQTATSYCLSVVHPTPRRAGVPTMGDGRNPLRTGVIGIVLVVGVVLVSFGYSELPFWPQGKTYQAYFTDAGGISPGNDVNVSGIKVGQVTGVALAGDVAKVTFTVDRKVKVGDQSLVSIKTDTILGQRSVAVTPRGRGESTTIPLNRTTAPYTLNNALQDLGQTASDLDKEKFTHALGVLTDSLHDATPQLRQALDGVAALSRSINANDEALAQLLQRAKSVTRVLADRAGQVNQLVVDGNQLFAALDERRAAISTLISSIEPVSQQISGFVADNRREFGPALRKLNAVLDNLLQRREHISEALKRLPPYATALGEVVASGPGFHINLYGLPPAQLGEVLLDTYFQPGKLPDSLADYLRGFISERLIIRPKSP